MNFHHSIKGLLFTVLLFSWNAQARNTCESIFTAKVSVAAKSTTAAKTEILNTPQDTFISQNLGKMDLSYTFWGQTVVNPTLQVKAADILKADGISLDSIQKAHRALTNGKATLKFRGSSDAKIFGTHSFKGFWHLTKAEIEAVEANPFLTFVPSAEVTKLGVINKENIVGDIVFPNYTTAKKFEKMLSKSTLESVKALTAGKKVELQEAEVNQAILQDLATWTLKEAEAQVKSGKDPPQVVLAMLEWRLKSLGLYYETSYISKGKYMDADYSRINLNRSNEVAELIVDAFAQKLNLSSNVLDRGYRPKMTDTFADWKVYMKEAVTGAASKKVDRLVKDLQDIKKSMPETEGKVFETFYLTKLMTGSKMLSATTETVVAEFNNYMKIHERKDIPEKERSLLIPIEFIRNFEQTPTSYHDYYNNFYFTDATLFRGVSNSNRLTDNNILEYFSSYKGRFSSEVSRSIFSARSDLTKLAMLQFNAELIEGKVVETAAQHAAKHMGYTAPNSAKTYFVSATDLSTIAFRFAMDKGYVSSSSSNADGNTHLVFEFLQPKHGVVEFSSFKQTDPTWKNYFPRQRESSIAGGLDPQSVIRVYVLAPYEAGEKVPTGGPEKHGKIIKMFERDAQTPSKVNVRVRESKDKDWTTVETFDLK